MHLTRVPLLEMFGSAGCAEAMPCAAPQAAPLTRHMCPSQTAPLQRDGIRGAGFLVTADDYGAVKLFNYPVVRTRRDLSVTQRALSVHQRAVSVTQRAVSVSPSELFASPSELAASPSELLACHPESS